MNRWIVNIEEDPDTGDLMLPLPPEVLEALSLKTGDKINWNVQDNGSIIISKQETELVLVECINQFRTRYLVEVPKGKKEWALDTVTMEEAKEFSQEHLTETIVSSRIISEQDALVLCKEDNNYMFNNLNRSEKEILASFITREGEQ